MRKYAHQTVANGSRGAAPPGKLVASLHSAPSGPCNELTLSAEFQRPVVLLRRHDVLTKLRICRSALHQWLDPESPYYLPDMPRPIKLSNRSRSSYWIEEEIDRFISRRVADARSSVAKEAL